MRDKLYRFMQGRNGMDDLCRMESGLVLVLLILGIFTRLGIFTTVALLLMIHMYYRALSKIQQSVTKKIRSTSILNTTVQFRGIGSRNVWHRQEITVFINARPASRKYVYRRDMEKSKSLVRNAEKNLFADRRRGLHVWLY